MIKDRQIDVLRYIALGYSPKETAERTNLSRTYVNQIMKEMREEAGANTTAHLVYKAVSEGWIE